MRVPRRELLSEVKAWAEVDAVLVVLAVLVNSCTDGQLAIEELGLI